MKNVLMFVIAAFVLISCNKVEAGKGGNGLIDGVAVHHNLRIGEAQIYIKYGAEEFPGTDLSEYDDNVTANANGEFAFPDLNEGNYFIYGAGFDPVLNDSVFGGIPVELREDESKTVVLAITED